MIEPQLSGALLAILGQLEANFTDAGFTNLCVITLMPGEEVPLDYCSQCDDGMAWVRLVSMQQPETGGGADTNLRCFAELAATIEVGHIFSAPWPDANGDLPTSEDHLAVALRQYDAADIMLRALLCADLPNGLRVTTPTYGPFGPQGGCVGGVWNGTMDLI
jgi:hypothetical protein